MAKPRVVNVQFNNEQIFWGEYANHLLAEGDSWFGWAHMNLAPSSNLLEELRFEQPAVVVSYAYSGDKQYRGRLKGGRLVLRDA